MVADDHQRARPERRDRGRRRRWSARRSRAPSRAEQEDRLDDQTRVVALVDVEPSLEHDDGYPGEIPQQEPTDVTRCGRRRPAGEVLERDGDRVGSGRRRDRPSPDPRTIPTTGHERRSRPDGGVEGRQPRRLVCGMDRATDHGVDRRSWEPPGACMARPAGGDFVRPDGSTDTGMPIASRRATARRRTVGETAARRGQRSARSDRRRTGGP